MPGPEILRLSAEVADALRAGRPIVALETSVIAQGLPQDDGPAAFGRWERAIRDAGAVPAGIAVLEGRLAVGLAASELARLADRSRAVAKAARRDLGALVQRRADAGTTVSATLAVARLAGIRVVATGGIGGVHRQFSRHPDESADLRALAETPIALVCAGAKAVLDLPATLERLETYSVPVFGHGTSVFPAFYTSPAVEDGLRLEHRFDEPPALAAALAAHFAAGGGGALVAVPPPLVDGLTAAMVEAAVTDAVEAAERAGVIGKALTPFLLAEVAERTGGLALTANLALLEKNARAAGGLASAWPPAYN
ncbi:MAG TPA: pseudouridine-5'-phosphate glycosidase [Myxococcales bacterium]|nr:pseudouridine-5'-phosphate glycosidase [Myxococcales bacterium]